MQARPTEIAEVLEFDPRVFGDERGFFFESYHAEQFNQLVGRKIEFSQDNHSRSLRGVLRGLHYQLPPHAQGKLVRVVQGEVYDVAVDIRRSSPTFGRWVGRILSASNRKQMWIPPGFAHGFLTLSESAEFLYKTTDYYAPAAEGCILWNDPTLAIDWPIENLTVHVSGKDAVGLNWNAASLFP